MTNGNGIGSSLLHVDERSDHAAQRCVPCCRGIVSRDARAGTEFASFHLRLKENVAMAGNTFDPDNTPFEGKRKTPANRYVRPLDPNDGTDPDELAIAGNEKTAPPGLDIDIYTDGVVGAYEASFEYGLDEAEEDDRGLH
jgi:hypothetical protein